MVVLAAAAATPAPEEEERRHGRRLRMARQVLASQMLAEAPPCLPPGTGRVGRWWASTAGERATHAAPYIAHSSPCRRWSARSCTPRPGVARHTCTPRGSCRTWGSRRTAARGVGCRGGGRHMWEDAWGVQVRSRAGTGSCQVLADSHPATLLAAALCALPGSPWPQPRSCR